MRDSKRIYTLNIGDYAPQITELTYPLIHAYAKKIGAEWTEIKERKYPDWPVTYEKLQIYDLAKEHGDDWAIYIDSDTLIHPQMFDPTTHLRRDTVCHNHKDMAGQRWRYDEYFIRDGRHIGSCNWFACASKMCLDLWHPIDDISCEEALSNIFPVMGELAGGMKAEHLIDDYALSRNIARYGLKYDTILEMTDRHNLAVEVVQGNTKQKAHPFFFHNYCIPETEKVKQLKETLVAWGIIK